MAAFGLDSASSDEHKRSADNLAMTSRTIEQLIDTDEPGIELVRQWLRVTTNQVELLDVDPEAGCRTLLALQVTSRSPMGALAYASGGLLVDGGWVRVLGGGHARVPRTLATWNRLERSAPRLPDALLVGDDVLGGFFAVNGGGLPGEPGHVFYFGPDSLRWEVVAPSYSDWLLFLFCGDLEQFYRGRRWRSWRDDLVGLAGDRAFSVYPPLWAAGPAIEDRSRRPVPIEELWGLHVVDWPQQLGP